MTLTIGPLTNSGFLFPVLCFVLVLDQTLVEHLYRDKVYDTLSTTVNELSETKATLANFIISRKGQYLTLSCKLNIKLRKAIGVINY